MSEHWGKCDNCNEYAFLNSHRCKPIFYFKHEDWGDKPQPIRGYDFEDAAENFAKMYNEDGDYALMNQKINVVISDGETEKTFEVGAEPDIHYFANELDTDPNPHGVGEQ